MDTDHNIKIADFGLAAVTAPFQGRLTLQCGTPEFTAPEITVGGCEWGRGGGDTTTTTNKIRGI